MAILFHVFISQRFELEIDTTRKKRPGAQIVANIGQRWTVAIVLCFGDDLSVSFLGIEWPPEDTREVRHYQKIK